MLAGLQAVMLTTKIIIKLRACNFIRFKNYGLLPNSGNLYLLL